MLASKKLEVNSLRDSKITEMRFLVLERCTPELYSYGIDLGREPPTPSPPVSKDLSLQRLFSSFWAVYAGGIYQLVPLSKYEVYMTY